VNRDYRARWIQGLYPRQPLGVTLHGSRSTVARPTHVEYIRTAEYVTTRTDLVGHACTIGDDEVAIHTKPTEWCHHARGCSSYYIGAEFAQPNLGDPISDAQIAAFCWYFAVELRGAYPRLALHFPTHAELDGTDLYGRVDGKSDLAPKGDPMAADVRRRILARLQEAHGIT
jgi:hypothetical protein